MKYIFFISIFFLCSCTTHTRLASSVDESTVKTNLPTEVKGILPTVQQIPLASSEKIVERHSIDSVKQVVLPGLTRIQKTKLKLVEKIIQTKMPEQAMQLKHELSKEDGGMKGNIGNGTIVLALVIVILLFLLIIWLIGFLLSLIFGRIGYLIGLGLILLFILAMIFRR